MKQIIQTVALLTSTAILSNCSVYMAVNQPDKKDLSVLEVGTPRPLVLHSLGSPISTTTRNNAKSDTFSFTQGYSKGNKATRAVWHGAADIVTLGLWEVVGTPSEAIFDGQKMSFIVDYNRQDLVSKVTDLTPKPQKSTAAH